MKSDPDQFAGLRLVIKLGGEIMLNMAGLNNLAREIALLVKMGSKVTLVHGGGPQADALAKRLGYKVRKVAGRRVTDDGALEVAKMVYGGSINLELLGALRRYGTRPVGLSGVDAGLITVTRRPPTLIADPITGITESVDFGHVGDVEAVDIALLDLLLAEGYLPIVASLAADREGDIYNVNADTVAQVLAVALHADKLILVTNVPGIMLDPTDPASLIGKCNVAQLRDLIASGTIAGGMLPKAQNCIEVIEAGVGAVQILNGTVSRPLLLESLTGETIGTIITES